MSEVKWDISYRQEERFTSRIKNVLESYAYGWGIFQEWLANADDAGARKFSLVLDTTQYDKQHSLCPDWQGPSILIFNDSVFRKQDWGNFTKKIGDSAKKNEKGVIGKFGLGALTMYHFSDIIQIISDTEVLFLDVHGKYLQDKNKSIKGNFLESKLLEKYPNQFAPFVNHSDLFGCTMQETFQGTLFRIPLRTTETANASNIKNTPTSPDNVEKLMMDFGCHLSDMLTFLRRVEEIEIMKIQGKERQLLFKVSVQNPTPTLRQQRLLQPSENLIHTLDSELSCTSFKLETAVEDFTNGYKRDEAKWMISLGLTTENDFSGVAAKIWDGISVLPKLEGKPFCFLPIISEPIGIPIHIHGSFQLSDNRRNLWMDNDAAEKTHWNKLLLSKIARLWANLLQVLTQEIAYSEAMKLYRLWPVGQITYPWALMATPTIQALLDRQVIHCAPLPGLQRCHEHHWVTPTEAVFNVSHPKEATLSDVNTVSGVLQALGHHLLQVPYANFKVLEANVTQLDPQYARDSLGNVDLEELPHEISMDLKTIEQILRYLISDGIRNDLHAISLIPLKNGSAGTFHGPSHQNQYFKLPKTDSVANSLEFLMGYHAKNIVHNSPILATLPEDEYNIQTLTPETLIQHGHFPEDSTEWIQHLLLLIDANWLKLQSGDFWNGFPFIQINQKRYSIQQLKEDTFFVTNGRSGSFKAILPLMEKHFTGFKTFDIATVPSKTVQKYLESELRTSFQPQIMEWITKQPNAVATMLQTDKQDFLQFRKFLLDQDFDPRDASWLVRNLPLLENAEGNFLCHSQSGSYFTLSSGWITLITISDLDASSILKDDKFLRIAARPSRGNDQPNIRPIEDFALQHIQSLSGEIYTEFYLQIAKETRYIEKLMNMPFIKEENRQYKLSELRDPECQISAKLFPDAPTLPVRYLDDPAFVLHRRSLGLFSVEQPECWIRCASAVQKPHLADKEKEELSMKLFQVLTDKITRFHLTTYQIEKIRAIPFLQVLANIPADKPYLELTPPRAEKQFACINELTTLDSAECCWTILYILHPSYNLLHFKKVQAKLQVSDIPTGVIVSHLTNLTTKLFEQWNGPGMYLSDFDKILCKNLEFLTSRKASADREIIQRLRNVPVVRNGTTLLPAAYFCLSLDEDLECMYRLPPEYRAFKELLVALGAEDSKTEITRRILPVLPESPVKFPGALPHTFDDPSYFTDVTFLVGYRKICAHRLVLSLQCERFKTQFKGGFKESENTVIEVDGDVGYEAFKHFLKFFYTGTLPETVNNPQVFIDLIKLADQYIVPYVTIWCEIQMISKRNMLSVELACDVLQYAILYRTMYLKAYCLEFIKSKLTVISRTESFKKLSEEAREILYQAMPTEMTQVLKESEQAKQNIEKSPKINSQTASQHNQTNTKKKKFVLLSNSARPYITKTQQ